MAEIKEDWGAAGKNQDPTDGESPTQAEAMRDAADDFAALRAAFVALTAKLDADAGVTDTNYAATLDPAAMKTTKG